MRSPNARGSGDLLREQLVRAASDLLLEPQLVALPSLRAVARRCHVSPAAVYLHFGSQQALVTAVVESHLEALRARLDEATTDASTPAGRLRAIGVAYARWGLDHPGAYQLLFESADVLPVPGHGEGEQDQPFGVVAALLADAHGPAAGTLPAALRLWSAVHGAVSLRIHKRDMGWPDLEDDLEHLLRR